MGAHPERRRVDRDRRRGQPLAGQLLGDQPAEGMAHDRRLGSERCDDGGNVVGDGADRLAREALGVLTTTLDGRGVVGHRTATVAYPADSNFSRHGSQLAREQPESVHEDDDRPRRGVGPLHLREFPGGRRCGWSHSPDPSQPVRRATDVVESSASMIRRAIPRSAPKVCWRGLIIGRRKSP